MAENFRGKQSFWKKNEVLSINESGENTFKLCLV